MEEEQKRVPESDHESTYKDKQEKMDNIIELSDSSFSNDTLSPEDVSIGIVNIRKIYLFKISCQKMECSRRHLKPKPTIFNCITCIFLRNWKIWQEECLDAGAQTTGIGLKHPKKFYRCRKTKF